MKEYKFINIDDPNMILSFWADSEQEAYVIISEIVKDHKQFNLKK